MGATICTLCNDVGSGKAYGIEENGETICICWNNWVREREIEEEEEEEAEEEEAEEDEDDEDSANLLGTWEEEKARGTRFKAAEVDFSLVESSCWEMWSKKGVLLTIR